MNLDGLAALHWSNQTLAISLAAVAVVALLLLIVGRLRRMPSHRATLLVANLLTVVAAALATMVSASGMWKFFTDILGDSPLRYAFFWFIEVALFASALLARARLLRDPRATTGVDGIAVWVFASLTAGLSALDSDSVREVCLRLAAPLVAAWMWERALAAERSVHSGAATRRIHWTLTTERVFVWLRLAEAQGRDVTEIDRARWRIRLGQARLNLYLLQSKERTAAWRLTRAHTKVIRRAIQAAEHIGLADVPDAADEREAIQMLMATIYGVVDATTPKAVAHLNAWQTTWAAHVLAATDVGHRGSTTTRTPIESRIATLPRRAKGHALQANNSEGAGFDTNGERDAIFITTTGDGPRAGAPAATAIGGLPGQPEDGPIQDNGDRDCAEEEEDDVRKDGDMSVVAAMRRFWDSETKQGRVPTGAKLSRAAGVPPATGLGRRMRRAWEAELPNHLRRPLAPVGDPGDERGRLACEAIASETVPPSRLTAS